MRKHFLILVCLTSVSSSAIAACTDQFPGHVAPSVLSAAEAQRTHLLCFTSYAVLESGATRTGVWSAEVLTRENVLSARGLHRDNAFHPEDSIPVDDRAELADYAHSHGYDRGHLTPSGDEPDEQSQAETFSLANMVPQAARNNRRVWEHIEASTRNLAKEAGEIYVVTGPAYTRGEHLLNQRVRIPDLLWKAIYVPGHGAAAYLTRNDSGQSYAVVSVGEIKKLSGVDPFPALKPELKERAIELPMPTPHKGEEKDIRLSENTLLSRDADEHPVEAGSRTKGGPRESLSSLLLRLLKK
jgi:endonuclease G